jgi:methyltransferase
VQLSRLRIQEQRDGAGTAAGIRQLIAWRSDFTMLSATSRAAVVAVAAFAPMVLEARRSRRNDTSLRARGAVEPPGDVYASMQVAYPGCFVAMIAESVVRDQPAGALAAAGSVIFLLAKALKYSAIAALGDRWTFRVLVLPGQPLVTGGPYRWLRHPNYVGVAGELIGAALMAGSPVAGVIGFAAFGGMMLARIRVEERALNICAP